MSDTPPSSFLHSPAVVVLVKGAVLIGALAMLFWGCLLYTSDAADE